MFYEPWSNFIPNFMFVSSDGIYHYSYSSEQYLSAYFRSFYDDSKIDIYLKWIAHKRSVTIEFSSKNPQIPYPVK